jgi:hypothetical protein
MNQADQDWRPTFEMGEVSENWKLERKWNRFLGWNAQCWRLPPCRT